MTCTARYVSSQSLHTLTFVLVLLIAQLVNLANGQTCGTNCQTCVDATSPCQQCIAPEYGFDPDPNSPNCDRCDSRTDCIQCTQTDTCTGCTTQDLGPILGANGGCAPCSAGCGSCMQNGAGKCDAGSCYGGYGYWEGVAEQVCV